MNRPCDYNLLFGILAAQLDFLTHDNLTKGLRDWLENRQQPLGELLVERGSLTAEHLSLLEPLVEAYTQHHGGNIQQSLAALISVEGFHESLAQIDDPDLNASLATLSHLPSMQDGGVLTSAASTDLSRGPIADIEQSKASVDRFETSIEEDTPPETTTFKAAFGPRFRILRPHAEGGLGKVSVALDSELQREVAFKEIKARYADDPATRARFLVEAEVTGGLEHPGIVPVYGLGHFPDGRPFYAMRFIRGQSLQDSVKAFHSKRKDTNEEFIGSREFRDLLNRLIDVCNAIQYAHDRKVLHRDLKPDNIMLGNYGETLIVDWGLAKAVGSGGTEEDLGLEQPIVPTSGSGSAPTRMGTAIGTPQYMPPEQASGDLHQLGPRSDIYSLGATLYEVLAGEPPLAGARIDEVLQRVAAGQVPSPRTVRSNIPPQLEAICCKAMSLRSENRYSSARQMANDLEAWLSDEPVTALREPLWTRSRRWMRKHQTMVNTTIASTLLAIMGLTVLAIVVAGKNSELAGANSDLIESNAKERQSSKLAANNALQAKKQQELAERQTARLRDESARRNVVRAWREFDSDNSQLALMYMGSSIDELQSTNMTNLTEQQKADFRIYVAQFNSIYQHHPLARCWPGSRFAAYSADSSRVVTCEATGHVSVWDAETNRLVWDVKTHQGAGTYAAFDPTGNFVVCGSHIGEVSVLNIERQEVVFKAPRLQGVSRVWFAEEDRIAVLTLDQALTLFDFEANEQAEQSQWPTGSRVLAYAPSGKTVAIATPKSDILSFVDTANLSDRSNSIEIADQAVTAAFSQDSMMLLTITGEALPKADAASTLSRIQVWSVDTQAAFGKMIELASVTSAAFVRNDQVIVATKKTTQESKLAVESAQQMSTIARYYMATGLQIGKTFEVEFAVREIVTSMDGQFVVAIGSTTTEQDGASIDCFQVFDLELGRSLTAVIELHSGEVSVEFNSSASSLLVFGHGFGVPLASEWDLTIPRGSSDALSIAQEPIANAAFLPNNAGVIAWTDSGKISVWDETGTPQPLSGGDKEFVVSVDTDLRMESRMRSVPTPALLKTGEAVTRSMDATYNVAVPVHESFQIPTSIAQPATDDAALNRALLAGIPLLEGNQHYAGLNSNYTLAAAQNNDNQEVRVWNIANGDAIAVTAPMPHKGFVELGRFSKNSRFLATASAVRPKWNDPILVVRVWDCNSGQPITPNLFHDGEIKDVQFNDDASILLVRMESGIQTWSLQRSIPNRYGLSKYLLARCIAGKDIDNAGEPVSIDWNGIVAESIESANALDTGGNGTEPLRWHKANALLSTRIGADDTARLHLDHWIRFEPNDATPFQLLGDIHGRRQDFSEAQRAFEKAREIYPDVAYSSYCLAVLARMDGRDDAYKKICETLHDSLAASSDPDRMDLMLWTHALSPDSVGDFNELLTIAERNARENPGIRRYLNTLAILAYRTGDLARASEALQEAHSISREFGHELVAETLRRQLSDDDRTLSPSQFDMQSIRDDVGRLRRAARDEKEELAILFQTANYEPEWVEEAEFSQLAGELQIAQ